jgi:ribonuclease HII
MAPPPPSTSRREAMRRHARALRAAGYERIAGADEVGCGPLAGPLVAAAVILPRGVRLPGVDDSKRMTAPDRERWADEIRSVAIAWSIAEVDVAEVDAAGPYQGAIAALTRAVLALSPAPDYVLVDARRLPGLSVPQEPVVGGDGRHLVIAAASVLAKVHRDRIMVELDARFPQYGFAQHKGYGTPEHLAALTQFGATPHHRITFTPIHNLLTPR